MGGLEGNVAANGPQSSNATQGLASPQMFTSTTQGLAIAAAVPTAGLKSQLCWSGDVSVAIRRVRRAAPQHHIDTQAACTLQPLWPTSQWLHKLCRRCARLHFACAAHAATPGLAFGDQF